MRNGQKLSKSHAGSLSLSGNELAMYVPVVDMPFAVDMREAFNLFDKDKDGRITCSELLTVMKELRQQASEDEIRDMITHADADGNCMITT